MDQREALEKAARFAHLARGAIAIDAAVLFGSHATGKADECSDVDVGLFVDRLDAETDYLLLLKELYGLAAGVDVHIEPHLFVRSEDQSGLGAQVEREGIRIEA
ncbi:MAG: nucleotidyltransferase domain-containing protein [Deltaproteobacteria bacterium]|nr:nucleotidyltransferase domain-containing protein [Deltaproteobacteria bacterium]